LTTSKPETLNPKPYTRHPPPTTHHPPHRRVLIFPRGNSNGGGGVDYLSLFLEAADPEAQPYG